MLKIFMCTPSDEDEKTAVPDNSEDGNRLEEGEYTEANTTV